MAEIEPSRRRRFISKIGNKASGVKQILVIQREIEDGLIAMSVTVEAPDGFLFWQNHLIGEGKVLDIGSRSQLMRIKNKYIPGSIDNITGEQPGDKLIDEVEISAPDEPADESNQSGFRVTGE